MHYPVRTLAALFTAGCLLVGVTARAETAPLNVYARPRLNLNGKWHIIVDPYETGYYDYRHEPLDASPNPKSGYFLDRKPANKSELVEYNFDESPTLRVPG